MFYTKLAKKNKHVAPKAVEAYRAEMIEQKVAERYTPTQEIAILRQKDTKPAEFQAYFEYVEQCKAAVDRELDEA